MQTEEKPRRTHGRTGWKMLSAHNPRSGGTARGLSVKHSAMGGARCTLCGTRWRDWEESWLSPVSPRTSWLGPEPPALRCHEAGFEFALHGLESVARLPRTPV